MKHYLVSDRCNIIYITVVCLLVGWMGYMFCSEELIGYCLHMNCMIYYRIMVFELTPNWRLDTSE